MRAAVLKAPNELVLAEAPEPRAECGDLVLRVKAATICGTDIRILRGRKTVGRLRRVRAGVVVNAGGAWIDGVNAALGLPARLMCGSKGAHLVVDSPRLLAALDGRMVYFFGTPDGRVNLVYPFSGRVLVGAPPTSLRPTPTPPKRPIRMLAIVDTKLRSAAGLRFQSLSMCVFPPFGGRATIWPVGTSGRIV